MWVVVLFLLFADLLFVVLSCCCVCFVFGFECCLMFWVLVCFVLFIMLCFAFVCRFVLVCFAVYWADVLFCNWFWCLFACGWVLCLVVVFGGGFRFWGFSWWLG